MFCGYVLYIGMAIMGILALVRGKISVTPRTVVEGPIARIIGVILLLPFPLGFGATMIAVIAAGATTGGPMPIWIGFIPIASVAVCVLVCFVLGFVGKKPLTKKRRRFDDLDDDEYDLEPPRTRAREAPAPGMESAIQAEPPRPRPPTDR
jgi:hypothetical protein